MVVRIQRREVVLTGRRGCSCLTTEPFEQFVFLASVSGAPPQSGATLQRTARALACDGRASVLRGASGLPAREYRVPFDMWWFRLPRHPLEGGDVAGLAPAFGRGEALLALTREDYYQLAYPIPKGSDARRRDEGVEAFRARVAALRPDLADRVEAIASMDDVFVLDVRSDLLRRWYTDGLLWLGDAAVREHRVTGSDRRERRRIAGPSEPPTGQTPTSTGAEPRRSPPPPISDEYDGIDSQSGCQAVHPGNRVSVGRACCRAAGLHIT